MFPISEIFYCLQGEGSNIGYPSLLVRFCGCNLHCLWCDTKYAINIKNAINTYTFDDLLIEIQNKIKLYNIKNIIFSGGEPTLYPIHELAQQIKLFNHDICIEVESNASLLPHEKFNNFDYSLFKWNLSPKGCSAGEKYNILALTYWNEMATKFNNINFKFVIRKNYSHDDLQEIINLEQTIGINKKNIILMPEGNTQNSQICATWLHDICLQYHYRLSLRYHVILFNDKRGF